MVYICTEFHENILDGIKEDAIFIAKISRGHNSVKIFVELRFFPCRCLMVMYIFIKFHENYSRPYLRYTANEIVI